MTPPPFCGRPSLLRIPFFFDVRNRFVCLVGLSPFFFPLLNIRQENSIFFLLRSVHPTRRSFPLLPPIRRTKRDFFLVQTTVFFPPQFQTVVRLFSFFCFFYRKIIFPPFEELLTWIGEESFFPPFPGLTVKQICFSSLGTFL